MSASSVPMAHASVSLVTSSEAPVQQRLPGGYRLGGGRPLRMLGVGATLLVHLAVGAVVMLGWPGAPDRTGGTRLISVTILPRPVDEPRRRPDPGTRASKPRPEPVPVKSSPPPAIMLAPPTPIAIETVAEMPAPAEGGRIDALALTTQGYRRAVMARLEAQRARGRDGASGAGVVLFRIERSGRLLDASVARSAGSRTLDRAALDVVRRAAPFPAIPEGLPDELEITLPVEFLVSARMASR